MATEKKGSISFGKGLALYATVLALLIAVALFVFYKYIESYENSRPTHALTTYFDQLSEDSLRRDAADFLASLDNSLRSEDESVKMLHELLSQAQTIKDVTAGSDTEIVYKLKNGKQVLGTVHIIPGDMQPFGFQGWKVDRAEYDFEALVNTYSVTVPQMCTVYCGDSKLSDDYISRQHIPLEYFEGFEEAFDFIPSQVEYTTGRYIGELEFTVKDSGGNTVEPESVDVISQLPACSENDQQRIRDFLQGYLSAYVFFLSGEGREFASMKLEQVRLFTVPGSTLDDRLYQAFAGGIGFASSLSDVLKSVDIHNTIDFGNGYYFCDFTYYVETAGQNGALTVTTNNSKIMLTDNGYGLLGCSQVSY